MILRIFKNVEDAVNRVPERWATVWFVVGIVAGVYLLYGIITE